MKLRNIIGVPIGLIRYYGYYKWINKETIYKYIWNSDDEKFSTDFVTLMKEKPNLNYFTIEFNDYYIQYMGWENTGEFYCETVSNNFLNNSKKLTDEKIKKLIDLNFIEPNQKHTDGHTSPNFSKYYKGRTENDKNKILEEFILIATEIYELKSNDLLRIRYE